MPQFMLLLNDAKSAFAQSTPEEMQAIFGRYRAWRESLVQSGRLAGSAKLKEEGGRHLRSRNGQVEVTDGPYTETKEVLGGYFTIQAADYDEAVEIARASPHLDYGWIELRQVDEM